MITATLVGSSAVQIVVDETPDGEAWTLTGTAGDFTWTVRGGTGTGDGEQLVLVDTRTPGNVPITYTFTAESGSESADPVTVAMSKDILLESLQGQQSLALDVLDESVDLSWASDVGLFRIPNRERPVVRYAATGDNEGVLKVLVNVVDSAAFRELARPGAPLVVRCGEQIMDLPLVFVVAVMGWPSKAYPTGGFRTWALPYALVDDPLALVPAGLFDWDFWDETHSAREWDDFDTVMTGLSWNDFDTADWSSF